MKQITEKYQANKIKTWVFSILATAGGVDTATSGYLASWVDLPARVQRIEKSQKAYWVREFKAGRITVEELVVIIDPPEEGTK